MIPGTVLLLGGSPWGALPDDLEAAGLEVLDVSIDEPDPQRYLTGVVVAVRSARPVDPLLLLATGSLGAALPDVGRALAIAGRRIGGYLFVDAALPGRPDAGLLDTSSVQLGDWPDAPCGYLLLGGHEAEARLARLRGWPVESAATNVATGILALIEAM